MSLSSLFSARSYWFCKSGCRPLLPLPVGLLVWTLGMSWRVAVCNLRLLGRRACDHMLRVSSDLCQVELQTHEGSEFFDEKSETVQCSRVIRIVCTVNVTSRLFTEVWCIFRSCLNGPQLISLKHIVPFESLLAKVNPGCVDNKPANL